MYTRHKQRGTSLIELIMFIVIVSVALAGVLLVMNVTTRGSADPLIHKQALAAAESLLEEIQLQDFDSQDGTAHVCINAVGANCVTLANRTSAYHIVRDYDGFSMAGITSLNGNSVGLGSYNASVVIADAALGSVAAGSAVRITVTVTDPQNNAIQISGYRTAR